MNKISRILTGTLFVGCGLVLMIVAPWAHFITLAYGFPLFILGFFILANKKEDEIEARKDLNKKKGKK